MGRLSAIKVQLELELEAKDMKKLIGGGGGISECSNPNTDGSQSDLVKTKNNQGKSKEYKRYSTIFHLSPSYENPLSFY